MARAVAAFFITAWGLLFGAFFAGLFVSMGHPTATGDHLMWGAFTLFFSTMCCVGFGRFLNDLRLGKILAAIAAGTILLIYGLRMTGVLPV